MNNTTNNSWTLNVEEDPTTGNSILVFNDEIMAQTGWQEGDVISWIDNHDGTWTLVKEDLTNFVAKGIINNEQN